MVPGVAAGVVALVLRRDEYRGPRLDRAGTERIWIAAPIAVGTAVLLIVTLAMVGTGWYPGDMAVLLFQPHEPALVTVFHYRAPYALASAPCRCWSQSALVSSSDAEAPTNRPWINFSSSAGNAKSSRAGAARTASKDGAGRRETIRDGRPGRLRCR